MSPEAAAYQAGHSKISMTQQHCIEEIHEALDTGSVTEAFMPKNVAPKMDQRANQPSRAELHMQYKMDI